MTFDQRLVSHPLGGLRVWGQKVKILLFQNTVISHIELKRITNAATWLQIFCLQTPTPQPTSRFWVWGQHSTFSEHGHVAYQVKEINTNSNIVANSLPAYTPANLGMGPVGQTSTFIFSEHGHVAYQIKKNL